MAADQEATIILGVFNAKPKGGSKAIGYTTLSDGFRNFGGRDFKKALAYAVQQSWIEESGPRRYVLTDAGTSMIAELGADGGS